MKEYREYNVSFRLTHKEIELLNALIKKRHTTKAVIIRDLLYKEFEKEGYEL